VENTTTKKNILPIYTGDLNFIYCVHVNVLCNALVAILLFLVDFSMFCIFYMKMLIM